MAPSYLKHFKVLLSLKITNILIWLSVSFFLHPQLPLWAHISGFPPPHLSKAERVSVLLSKSPVLSTTLVSE